MRSLRSKLILGALAIVFFLGLLFGRFTSIYTCLGCGMGARETEWQIPLTDITLFAGGKTLGSTPLSETLTSLHLVPAEHAHNWCPAHGSGNGIMCALGSGGPALLAAESSGVAQVIRAAHLAGDTALRDRFIRGAFDRPTARQILMLGISLPDEALSDASAFVNWRTEQAAEIEEALTPRADVRR